MVRGIYLEDIVMDNVQKAFETIVKAGLTLEEAVERFTAAVPKKGPELFHGYTMEQWQRIIDGGYLCQTWNHRLGKCVTEEWLTPLLGVSEQGFDIGEYSFFRHQQHCRPAQRYGVLTPHFGGPKPEWLNDSDLIVWRREGGKAVGLNSFATYIACGVEWNKVDEFIAMPGDA